MKISSISPKEAKDILEKSHDRVSLLDVRSEEEYQHVHIDGAQLIPLNRLIVDMNEVDKNKKIIIYCASGNRSQYACGILRDAGFDVVNMDGGINAWIAHGLAVV